MICPTCGTHIPDGSLRCPACHASVTATAAMPVLQGRWCPACGGGVGWDDQVCPHCGLPLESEWGAPQAHEAAEPQPADTCELPSLEQIEAETQETRSMARIESAIPAEHDPESKVAEQEVMPRTRAVLLAAMASLALVGGLALYLAHPWDPGRRLIGATEEADTSMAGFPGTVEALSGQDSQGRTQVELSGDEATYAQLSEAYEALGRYAERADESCGRFEAEGLGGDADAREQGKRDAQALAIDVSNLIDTLGQVDVSSGTYATDRDNLFTLGSWLRNRVDTITSAWVAAADSQDPAADADRLRALMAEADNPEGVNAYKALFDEHYEQWRPEEA